jgi:hypothetical protein
VCSSWPSSAMPGAPQHGRWWARTCRSNRRYRFRRVNHARS